ncbi:hypothetical protein [Bacteriovorax sp. Seq25_V]|uniref:hypothetical protein n=1 Tax=Bacteriovorax sp. Seq25_V TaxID=1201288 RepID=UPI000389DFB5|nr:hypothetical protein [Bacteriovorax sp. Seq25_V]EQC46317.1 hypothetical protein M900_1063 [Bacteriovorax sp. Seq25_V]
MQIHIFSKIALFSLISIPAFAEYRVYQYIVSPRLQTRTPSSFTVTSTLDPKTYVTYHGGMNALRINLLKTWTCKGNTSASDICDDPVAKLMLESTTKELN